MVISTVPKLRLFKPFNINDRVPTTRLQQMQSTAFDTTDITALLLIDKCMNDHSEALMPDDNRGVPLHVTKLALLCRLLLAAALTTSVRQLLILHM